jgi:hypothetical protein
MRRTFPYAAAIVVFLGFGHQADAAPPSWTSSASAEPQDSGMAITSPDEYAWRLFVALNWPALAGKRASDPSKRLGDAGRTVWESWMLVSGGPRKSQVYRLNGASPAAWDASLDQYCDATARDTIALQNALRQGTEIHILFEPGAATPGVDEVRMNEETLKFVTDNSLYNIDGQEELVNKSATSISFKLKSKEVKAQWREIDRADAARYHACEFQGKLYGLTALHILTKDLPNWFWTTFEHIDNKKPENLAKRGYGPWLLASKDKFACTTAPYDCEDFPKEIGLEGTKWQNYRLRGTQVDFVDSFGKATLLANSQVETDFQPTSSCMSCHARASIGRRQLSATGANRLNIVMDRFPPTGNPVVTLMPVGVPNPSDYADISGGTGPQKPIVNYTQLDFIWSLFRAQRKSP